MCAYAGPASCAAQYAVLNPERLTMQIKGTKTIHEVIDVNMNTLVDAITQHVRNKYQLGDHYVTAAGDEESWYDTGHGSGLTTDFGKPTGERMRAFKFLEDLRWVTSM